MTNDFLEEYLLLQELAVARWGITGFCCPHCGHLHAGLLMSRARVRKCLNCKRQTSVTSGTVLHGCRISLAAVKEVVEAFLANKVLPTVTQLVDRWEFSRNTGWWLLQKVMRAAREAMAPGELPNQIVALQTRRAKPKPMTVHAPRHVQDLHASQARGLQCWAGVALKRTPGTSPDGLDHVALGEVAVHPSSCGPGAFAIDRSRPGTFEFFLRHQVVRLRRKVSLRWLPRWVAACLQIWNHAGAPTGRSWWEPLLTLGRRVQRELDPWLPVSAP